jgi:CRP-like cAMP-binding protein
VFNKINLDTSYVLEILACAQLERRSAKDYVCFEGDHGESFYMILQGSVSVLIRNEEKSLNVNRFLK